MAEPVVMSVAFAYGASDRTGAAEGERLRRGLGLQDPPTILDWGRAAWNPPPSLEAYLGADRWAGRQGLGFAPEPGEREREMEAAEEAAYAARTATLAAETAAVLAGELPAGEEFNAALQLPSLPAWLRRLALRRVQRSIAAAYLTLSDALHYVARGAEIRALVARSLDEWAVTAPAPRVAIGLSLGGTILVDTLAEMLVARGTAPVDLLVTVGAQAPVLYRCDALASARPPGAVPGDGQTAGSLEPVQAPLFTPWLNVWNPDDLLSFQTHGAFDLAGIRDVAVSDPGAFPENHTDYFANAAVFAAIDEAVRWLAGRRFDE